MSVGPTKAKRAHSSDEPPTARARKLLATRARQHHVKAIEIELRVELGKVQVAWHVSVLERHHQLNETCHPCSRLGVPDVALDCTQHHRRGAWIPSVTVHRLECPNLDRIAKRSPGSVGLDHAEL